MEGSGFDWQPPGKTTLELSLNMTLEFNKAMWRMEARLNELWQDELPTLLKGHKWALNKAKIRKCFLVFHKTEQAPALSF